MKNVIVIGAGKSTPSLIDYLKDHAQPCDWHVTVADCDLAAAEARVAGHDRCSAIRLNVENEVRVAEVVKGADLVVSMVPAHMHGPVAEAATHHRTHMVSASYVSPDIRALQEAAEHNGVTLLSEMGVDPGIDHMSAMDKLDELRADNAKIKAFETFTGGLVAPESDDNPWSYKFTWNPRNVVIAGQGGVKFKLNNRYKYVPYHKLFTRYEPLSVPGWGDFEGYPNRDSLRYRRHYDLFGIDTIYRGTMRRPGFCRAWDCLVQLGLTDDSFVIDNLQDMTYRDFVNSFLWYDKDMSVELKVRAMLKLDLNSPSFDRLEWLGLFEKRPIGLDRGTPAQVLQKLLEDKWALAPDDRDMIVMLHKFTYEKGGKIWQTQSYMVTLGEDQQRTAMAKTVGLPAAIAAKLVLTGEITRRGVIIPTVADVYDPVLAELRDHGICFEEQTAEIESNGRSV
jgi:saccharopine dehydrogenase (NAD+, L-glutamate forming)